MGLHRLREAGLLHDIFDSLDERPFTLDQLQLHEFFNVLFIGDKSGVTDELFPNAQDVAL